MKKVSIYGIGNFGYAILKHLDRKESAEFSLSAYDRNPLLSAHLDNTRQHLTLFQPVEISQRPLIEQSSQALLADCDVLILSVTSDSIGAVLEEISPFITKPLILVNTSKAFHSQTGLRISEIVAEKLAGKTYNYAMLSGGMIASDLLNHGPLGASLACQNQDLLPELAAIFASEHLFIYPTDDVAGVECAAAFKNVISILAGITNGLGLPYSVETRIISRAAAEVEKIAIQQFGAQAKTFSLGSQCWGNDLWVSCTGKTRNKEFGILIGQGWSLEEAEQKMKAEKKTIEGLKTITALPLITKIEDYHILHLIHLLFSGKINLAQFKMDISKRSQP
ncbi:MAG: NAD(P)H-dependent glycerol-3-phosphate dehydrogenase [Patescibacteria group bacterium]